MCGEDRENALKPYGVIRDREHSVPRHRHIPKRIHIHIFMYILRMDVCMGELFTCLDEQFVIGMDVDRRRIRGPGRGGSE